MKRKNIICIISNVILSVVYFLFSWMVSFTGFMLLVHVSWDKVLSFCCILELISIILIFATTGICIAAIVLSNVFRRKEEYAVAFLIQFLPIATLLYAGLFWILSWIFAG